MIKSLLISIISIALSANVFAQESNYDQLNRFDADKFKEHLNIYKAIEADSIVNMINSQLASINNFKYSIRISDVPEQSMPKMQIVEDFHYTLEIKKYPQRFVPEKLEPNLNNGESKPKPILLTK